MPIFIETTIQIDRVIGEQEKRDRIRRNLNNQIACTCGHVLAEYKKTLIRDAITFRNLLLTSPDVATAVIRFSKYSRTRKYPRVINLLENLGRDKDKHNTLARLDSFIDWQAEDHFWEYIDQSLCVDNIKCNRQYWRPSKDFDGQYSTEELTCHKNSKTRCSLNEFIEHESINIARLREVGKSSVISSVAKAANLFDAVLSKTDVPYGEKNCYTLSDALIVLESFPEHEVYSHDDGVKEICGILGRSFYHEIP
jgi:hypothetical protein